MQVKYAYDKVSPRLNEDNGFDPRDIRHELIAAGSRRVGMGRKVKVTRIYALLLNAARHASQPEAAQILRNLARSAA